MTISKINTPPTQKELIDKTNEIIDNLGNSGANTDLSNLTATGEAHFQAPLVSGTNIKTINSNSILGSGNIEAITADSLVEIPCVVNEYVLNNTRVRIWSNGMIEQWMTDYTQTSAGAYMITYPVEFTSTPALFVDYHLAATASTSTTTRNYGYSRNKAGFYVYLAANAQINFYAVGY